MKWQSLNERLNLSIKWYLLCYNHIHTREREKERDRDNDKTLVNEFIHEIVKRVKWYIYVNMHSCERVYNILCVYTQTLTKW